MSGNSRELLWDWMNTLHDHGCCILCDIPEEWGADDPRSTVVQLGSMIGPVSTTIYGVDFSVKTETNPINIAYTNKGLKLHMDLPYYESPPGVQMLHCLQRDEGVEGGESTLLDVMQFAEIFREQHPDHFQSLSLVPRTFQKDHLDRADPVQMYYQRPHISVCPDGQVIGVFWSPPFEGTLFGSFEECERYYAAYRVFAELLQSRRHNLLIEFQLNKGEVLTFNQRRMLHGRNPFELTRGAQRHLKGCYINVDEFLNRYRVLALEFGGGDRRVDVCFGQGNQAYMR